MVGSRTWASRPLAISTAVFFCFLRSTADGQTTRPPADPPRTRQNATVDPVVYRQRGEALEAVVIWGDAINGESRTMTATLGFLLSKDISKYIPGAALPESMVAVLARGYTVNAPTELHYRIVEVVAGLAEVGCGGDLNPNAFNSGIGVRVTLSVHLPQALPPGKRKIVLTFPGALRIRDAVGADSPARVPEITFEIRNFRTNTERAAAFWWSNMAWGFACLLATLIVAPIVAASCEDVASGVTLGIAVAIALTFCTCHLMGLALRDLQLLNARAYLLLACCISVPYLGASLLIRRAWMVGLAYLGLILVVIAVDVIFSIWQVSRDGAYVMLPGATIGIVMGFLFRRGAASQVAKA